MTPVIKTYISVKSTGCGLPLHLLCNLLIQNAAFMALQGKEKQQHPHPKESILRRRDEWRLPLCQWGGQESSWPTWRWLLWYDLHQLPLPFLLLLTYWSLPPLVYMDTRIKPQLMLLSPPHTFQDSITHPFTALSSFNRG